MKKFIIPSIVIVVLGVLVVGFLSFQRRQNGLKKDQNYSSQNGFGGEGSKLANIFKNNSGQDTGSYLNIEYSKIDGVDKNLLSLDIYNVDKSKQKPVVIMVHGGAWTIGDKANKKTVSPKKEYFDSLGYLFVSINYRMAPDYFFPDYPNDVATAIRWVSENIKNYGGDSSKIFVMGHSAGAHLSALTLLDESYQTQNLGLKGLILLDGAGYDIPIALKTSDTEIRTDAFEKAFGKDPEVHKKASPMYQIKKQSKLAPTLILYAQRRQESKDQSEKLYQAILDSGNQASIFAIPNTNHEQMNSNLGKQDFLATQKVGEFLLSNS